MSFTVPVAFRRTLARELPSWRADGLVGETASLALTARYGLNRLAEPDDRWVARTFALLGAVAIGAGVLSFVAAHWGQLDALARFAIVATTAIAAYAAGLVLRGRGNTVFAEAALVAGSLAFGGAIALGAQEFNASLELWQVYALWGAGLVPLAFVLRSVPVGTVALAAGAASVPLHVGSFGHEMPFIHFAIASALAAVLARRFGLLWYRELALALAAVGVFIVLFGESTNAASAAIAGVAALALAAGAARSAVVAVGATVIAFLAALPATYWFAYNAGWQAEHDVRLGAAGVALLVAIAVAVWHVRRRDVLPLAPPAAALGASSCCRIW
ncbi:MAG TPA: DUF2157 domain-containing protein [Candidatus Elarobacter sp.]|nr:DUF2157 domain-containing protein [Candidatus Elarobacter sp.]